MRFRVALSSALVAAVLAAAWPSAIPVGARAAAAATTSVTVSYPASLDAGPITGRGTSSQWHTQTRTSKSAVLRQMYPQEAYVEINPQDAGRLRIRHAEVIYVSTLRGKVRAQAVLTTGVKPGQIFMPMHYEETNQLTFASFDPYSRQPSYKICSANVSRKLYD